MKRFQLMQKVNAEGLYGCVQACLPYFENNGWKGRIVVVCPPIYERFFRGKTAYAMGKVGMSVLVKGLVSTYLQPLQFPQSMSPDGFQLNHVSHLEVTFSYFPGISRKTANFLFSAGYGFQKGGKDRHGRDGYLACLCKPTCPFSFLSTRSLSVMRYATQM